MKSANVVAFLELADDLGVRIWIDGGWAVDALLGEQTRPHSDLDIVVQQRDVTALRARLKAMGYRDVERDDTSIWNFVLGDAEGHEIDFHAIVFDRHGNGLYGPPERGVMYPAESLTGQGVIAGRQVNCIEPTHLVGFHTGYELREVDYRDVTALCERFGVELPDEYARFKRSRTK